MDDTKMTFEQFIVAASNHSINAVPRVPFSESYMASLRFHRKDLYDEVIRYSRGLNSSSQYNPNLYHNQTNLPEFLTFIAARW